MKIINRENELSIIEELLNEVANLAHTPEQCIREFIGIAGSGKSILMKKVCEVAREYDITTLYVNFEGLQYKQAQQDEIKVVFGQALLDQLQLPISEAVTIREIIETCISAKSESLGGMTKALFESLVAALATSETHNKYIFIFDALDRLSEEFHTWIEGSLLIPLLAQKEIVPFGLLISSRYQIGWKNYIVKEALAVFELQPFTEEETISQVMGSVDETLARRLYQDTGGLPLLNEYIAKRINELSQTRGTKLLETDFGIVEARLVRDMVNTVLSYKVINAPQQLVEIFRYASIASFFDVDLLEKFMEHFFSSRLRNPSALLRLQQQLVSPKLNLAQYDLGKRGIVINPVVRKAMSLDIRLNETHIYQTIAEIITSIMKERLEDRTLQIDAICEIMLQRANITSLDAKCSLDEILDETKKDLSDFLEHKCKGRFGLASAFDLVQVISQFKELRIRLGTRYDELIELVNNFIDREVQEQEKLTQKIVLEIRREENSKDNYYQYQVSMTLPSTPKQYSEPYEVGKQIRRGLDEDLESLVNDPKLEKLVKIGSLLFRTFIPPKLGHILFSTKLPICIITDESELPWELMNDGTRFLCREKNVSRLLSALFEDVAESTTAIKKSILLIANTTNDESLYGTEREVEEIASLAQQAGFIPEIWLGQKAKMVQFSSALSNGDYGVIHFAGHAIFNGLLGQGAGIQLADGLYSTSNIRSMLGNPFVFINACFSGQAERIEIRSWNWGTQSLGLASDLVNKGASGCVGTLWQIPDKAASDFAIKFYTLAFNGFSIAKAMMDTRRTFEDKNLAWASYLVYCDPVLRLLST